MLDQKEEPMVRILVVDDNPAVRHYLRALLEQQSSWQVCAEARTGKEAIQRVESNRCPANLEIVSRDSHSDGHDPPLQATDRGGPKGRDPRSLREIRCGVDRSSRGHTPA
jgi:CheY-like chemotaxis protein